MAAPELRLPARQETRRHSNLHPDCNYWYLNNLRDAITPAQPLLMRRVG